MNQAGSYGSKGSASSSNVPGGRMYATSWLGKDGTFWLYGGASFDSTGQLGYTNDLWKFSNNEWTWVAGPNVGGTDAVYGKMGTPSANNTPGNRNGESTWTDSTGNLWMFGGEDSDGGAFLNDLWEYSSGEWTWVGGSNNNQIGIYGTQGVFSPGNAIGGRTGAVAWLDTSGNLWVFGGFGLDSTGETTDYLSDLWEYSEGQWAWIGGPPFAEQPAIYGTKGQPAPANVPGPRGWVPMWVDSNQNFWIFGGIYSPISHNEYWYNDVWKLVP